MEEFTFDSSGCSSKLGSDILEEPADCQKIRVQHRIQIEDVSENVPYVLEEHILCTNAGSGFLSDDDHSAAETGPDSCNPFSGTIESDVENRQSSPIVHIKVEPEVKESSDIYATLKKRFNLKEMSIIVHGLTPRQLELLRRKAELERLLVHALNREKLPRPKRKSVVNVTNNTAEGILCPVPDCRCTHKFQTPSELEIHQKRYHEGVKKPYTCQSCSKSFLTERILDDHMNTHRGEKPYLCSECGFTSSSNDMLARHRRKTHSVARRKHIFTCKHCKDKFESRKLWELHSLIHLPPEEQAAANQIEEDRKVKKKRKLGDKKLSCDVCDFKARYPSHLQEHLLIHSKKTISSCHVCGMGFKRNSALTSHMAVHSNERPFLCAHCGKSFKLKKTLTAHLHLHDSNKCYKCPECPKQYSIQSLLTQHIISHKKKGHLIRPYKKPSSETLIPSAIDPSLS
ncbi:unnamed protein product [Allacma fusca]|nr:unnamed protein product [Allacma fusca]